MTAVARSQAVLGFVGRATRRRLSFLLQVSALLWGVVHEGARPATWRRTLRAGFRASLTRLVAGSLGTILVTALVVGLGLVFEALYWLHTAGQEEQIGRILVVVLLRELTPLLIGIILLGRGGTAIVAELGLMQTQGEVAMLQAEGLDIFQFLVLPRAVAFAVGSFTLGILFILLALLSGFVTGSALGAVSQSFFGFLDAVLRAMSVRDLILLPAKLLLIGVTVALVCCATGLGARDNEPPGLLLPRGFTRGITGVLLVSVLLSAIL